MLNLLKIYRKKHYYDQTNILVVAVNGYDSYFHFRYTKFKITNNGDIVIHAYRSEGHKFVHIFPKDKWTQAWTVFGDMRIYG